MTNRAPSPLSDHSSLAETDLELEDDDMAEQNGGHSMGGVTNAAVAAAKAKRAANRRNKYSIFQGLKTAGGVAIAGVSWTRKPNKVGPVNDLETVARAAQVVGKGKRTLKKNKEYSVAAGLKIAAGVAIAGASWTRPPAKHQFAAKAQAVRVTAVANREIRKQKDYSIAAALKVAGGVAIAGASWTRMPTGPVASVTPAAPMIKPVRRHISFAGAAQAVRAFVKARQYIHKSQKHTVAKALRIAASVAIAGASWTRLTKDSEQRSITPPSPTPSAYSVPEREVRTPPPRLIRIARTPTPEVITRELTFDYPYRMAGTPDYPPPKTPIQKQEEPMPVPHGTPDIPYREAQTPPMPIKAPTPTPAPRPAPKIRQIEPTGTPDIPYREAETPPMPAPIPKAPQRVATQQPVVRTVTPYGTPDIPYREAGTPPVISSPTPEPIRKATPKPVRQPTPKPVRQPTPEPVQKARTPTPPPPAVVAPVMQPAPQQTSDPTPANPPPPKPASPDPEPEPVSVTAEEPEVKTKEPEAKPKRKPLAVLSKMVSRLNYCNMVVDSGIAARLERLVQDRNMLAGLKF